MGEFRWVRGEFRVKKGDFNKGEKRVEKGHFAGIQGENKSLLENHFLQSERLYNGNQQRRFY